MKSRLCHNERSNAKQSKDYAKDSGIININDTVSDKSDKFKENQNEFQCKECEYATNVEDYLKRHMKRRHQGTITNLKTA